VFDRLHPAQLALYDWLLVHDHDEEVKEWRDRLEYIALFIDSEKVLKLQKIREQGEGADDEAFNAVLKNTFGKPLDDGLDKIKVRHKDGTTEDVESSFARKIDPNDFIRK
jgi:hypothetical protein